MDWARTVLLPVAKGSRLRVVDLDSLIRLKLRAGGPQDLIDVVQLPRRHPEAQAQAIAVAEAHGLRERLQAWLTDPRIRSPELPKLTALAQVGGAEQAPRERARRRKKGS